MRTYGASNEIIKCSKFTEHMSYGFMYSENLPLWPVIIEQIENVCLSNSSLSSGEGVSGSELDTHSKRSSKYAQMSVHLAYPLLSPGSVPLKSED